MLRRSVSQVNDDHRLVIAPGNADPFEETSQQWLTLTWHRTVSDLTGRRFELQISSFRGERVTSGNTGRFFKNISEKT